MFHNSNPKRGPETFIVGLSSVTETINTADGDSNLVADANRAMNTNFTNGVVGVTTRNRNTGASDYYVPSPGSIDVEANNPLRIVQATEDTQDLAGAWRNRTYPLAPRAFIQSTEIQPFDRVRVRAQVYSAPTNTVWVVGDTGAVATGGIQALDNTEYAFTIAYRGRIADEYFSPEGTGFYTVNYTTPDYTGLGTSFPVDHLVQNLVWRVNRNSVIVSDYPQSQESVVGIALDLTGTAGTLVSALTPGFLPLINTTSGVRGISIDADMVATLQAALPSGSSIVTVDLTTAGTANNVQSLALVALDRRIAYRDENPSTKIRIDVGLRYGFDSNLVHIERTSRAKEAQGSERQLRLWWNGTHRQRQYSLDHEQIPVINYASPFETGVNYNTLIIENVNARQIDTHNTVHSPQKTIVCIPTGNAVWGLFTAQFQEWAAANGFGTLADWAA